jgi:CRP-like cAMP-binding protein
MNSNQVQAIVEAFEASPMFQIFTQAEKTQLARKSKIVAYHANQEVFSIEHKGGDCLFLVAEGTFKLLLKNKKFKPFTKGEIFGEIAVFHEKSRTGVIHAVTDGALVAICRDVLMRENLLPSELRYKLLLILAQQMAGYFHEDSMSSSQDLVQRGESETVEFKSSIEYKDSIAQAICAFMNNRGGAVLIGVNDQGRVFGIGDQNTSSQLDEQRREIGTFLKNRLGGLANSKIKIDVDRAFGKIILRIDCLPSETPVFFHTRSKGHGVQRTLYVRHDTRNEKYDDPKELIEYARKRFPA